MGQQLITLISNNLSLLLDITLVISLGKECDKRVLLPKVKYLMSLKKKYIVNIEVPCGSSSPGPTTPCKNGFFWPPPASIWTSSTFIYVFSRILSNVQLLRAYSILLIIISFTYLLSMSFRYYYVFIYSRTKYDLVWIIIM